MRAMSYRGRFAPTPSGDLHGGSLVAALGSWLRARAAGGRWLVRMDDLDPPREVPGAAGSILAALRVYGLVSDEPVVYQSRRHAAYGEAFERLHRDGHVFPCWCSRRDLADHDGLHRDGRCVSAPRADRPPAWRLRVPPRTIGFEDALQGPVQQDVHETVGDIVLRRGDGVWSYHLACVVDDAFQGITEIVRGCDLLDSTPRQILLQQLLGLPTPRYLHLPLALRTDASGKLSKSTRDLPLDRDDPVPTLRRALRFLGIEPASDTHVQGVLEAAIGHFEPQGIPHRRQAPWPGFA